MRAPQPTGWLLRVVLAFAAALVTGAVHHERGPVVPSASLVATGPSDVDDERPDVRLRVANLRTTAHECSWEFDWVVDNYGGVGATIVERRNRIVGETAEGPLPPWEHHAEMSLRVEPWARVSFRDHAQLEEPVEGCAFRATLALDMIDDRGLRFTARYEVAGRNE